MKIDPNEILLIAEMSKCSETGIRVDCAAMSIDKTNHRLCEIETSIIMQQLFGCVAERDFDPKWKW